MLKHELHAVSRTQKGRQSKPSVKTLRCPLSDGFWRYCMLSGETQRSALPRHRSEETKIFNISFPRVRIRSTTTAFSSYLNKEHFIKDLLS